MHLANQQSAPVVAGPASPAPQPAPSGPAPGAIYTNSILLQLAYIPAGTFQMGSPPSERERDIDERQFQVQITHGFRMSVTTVTQKQWHAVMGEHYVSPDGMHPDELLESHFVGDSFPVSCVSWFEANEFCRRLSALEHRTYRLPTEAEWEYACRAGTTTAFSFGDVLSASTANVDASAPYGAPPPADDSSDQMRPTPVGSYPPNSWGLYDMHGNVMQWCADWYGDYPLGSAVDPAGPEKGTTATRVVRGGSWLHAAKIARSASRWSYPPVIRSDYIGFRIVLEEPR
jgi:formylglycine-generating enzyme required for sulfatase activity